MKENSKYFFLFDLLYVTYECHAKASPVKRDGSSSENDRDSAVGTLCLSVTLLM